MRFANQKGNGSAKDFVSTLAVHQDGSCNGLQHYAALGKDSEGAKAVNLTDNCVPQDVYSDVLEHVGFQLHVAIIKSHVFVIFL